jgi:putative hydrolase
MIEIVSDLHTHTTHSHGKGNVEDNVKAAIDKGLEAVAISDHGFSHLLYRVRDIDRYLDDIHSAKEKYAAQIKVLISIELNLISLDGSLDMPEGYWDQFDLTMFGYHKLAGYRSLKDFMYFMPPSSKTIKAIPRNTEAYIAAIEKNRPSMISHLGYGLPVDKVRVCEAARQYGAAIEINAKHPDFTVDQLKACAGTGVSFVVGSDAHSAARVADFGPALDIAQKAGITAGQIINAKHQTQEGKA